VCGETKMRAPISRFVSPSATSPAMPSSDEPRLSHPNFSRRFEWTARPVCGCRRSGRGFFQMNERANGVASDAHWFTACDDGARADLKLTRRELV